MCSTRVLRYMTVAAVLLAAPQLLAAQEAARRIRPDALRELRANLPEGAALTRSNRAGVDTVSPSATVMLRAGELLVVKEGEVAAAAEMPTAPMPVPVSDDVDGPAPAQGMDTTAAGPAPSSPPPPPPVTGAADSVAVTRLPYTLGIADPTAPSGLRILEARVEIVGGGFRYDPEARAYVGQVLIGIVDRDRPGQRISLTDVFIQIGGEVEWADPRVLSLLRTSVPFQEVALRARPRADSVRIRLIPSFDPAGITISVPVLLPPVVVRAAPVRIAGLGLERADVLIEPPFRGVLPMIVTAQRADPEPNRVAVGPAEAAEVRVRSRGVGTDTILVIGDAYRAQLELVYETPWLFAVAVVVGGALGGVLNAISRTRRASGTTLRRLALTGVLTGLGVAVLYAVGIQVFDWAPDGEYGEALMFALSFMGGLAGPRIFDRFLPPARKERDPAPSEPRPEPAGVG
jgi:uncharacterized membrane protein